MYDHGLDIEQKNAINLINWQNLNIDYIKCFNNIKFLNLVTVPRSYKIMLPITYYPQRQCKAGEPNNYCPIETHTGG